MKEVAALGCLLGIGVAAVVAMTAGRQPAPASDASRSPNPVGPKEAAPSSFETAPRPVRVALEELEYQDAGFRAAAAGRLIERGPDARPYVEGVLQRAKTAGKEQLAAECQRILDGMMPFRDFCTWVKRDLEPGDTRYRYPDPPNVRTDAAPDRLLPGTFLFGIQGRLYGSVGPPPSVVRIFVSDAPAAEPFEVKTWNDILDFLRPAKGDQEVRETSHLVIRLWARGACPCMAPGEVRLEYLTAIQTTSGWLVKGRARSPVAPDGCSFEIEFGEDGRIRKITPLPQPHFHQ